MPTAHLVCRVRTPPGSPLTSGRPCDSAWSPDADGALVIACGGAQATHVQIGAMEDRTADELGPVLAVMRPRATHVGDGPRAPTARAFGRPGERPSEGDRRQVGAARL